MLGFWCSLYQESTFTHFEFILYKYTYIHTILHVFYSKVLFVAAIVFFDPDFYTVKEGLPAELFLRINATLDKNVTVTVEDKPNSAISK